MSIKFLPEARDELLEAVAYYEGEASRLGWRLWEEVERHIAWIERNYEVPRTRPGGYRRVRASAGVRRRMYGNELPEAALTRNVCVVI